MIGDRIKKYEAVSQYTLPAKSPVIIRVDGKAFHSFTRGMERPFDNSLAIAMVDAAVRTSAEMMGFKLAYVQSDECTFAITDYPDHDTQGWFDYKLSKIVSVSASMYSTYFNSAMGGTEAVFDSRAFNVPRDEVANVFIWRQRDWERNSLQMLARHHFSSKELHKKNHSQIHDMLFEIGVNWADLTPRQKNGTFITPNGPISEKLNYEQINELICQT